MKRCLAIAISVCGMCSADSADTWLRFDAPQGNQEWRMVDWTRPELGPLQDAYAGIIKLRLWPLSHEQVVKIFGPKLEATTNWRGYSLEVGRKSSSPEPELGPYPADLVPPIFAPGIRMLAAEHAPDPAWHKDHTEYYAVGDIGYVGFCDRYGSEMFVTVSLDFRVDDKFVPLASTNDFSKRLEWDKAKFEALKSWLDEHMPKPIDLGVLEVSLFSPSRVDLGGGKTRVLRTRRDSTNYAVAARSKLAAGPRESPFRYEIDLGNPGPNPKEMAPDPWQFWFDGPPREPIGFSIDGKLYRLTPVLIEELPDPNE